MKYKAFLIGFALVSIPLLISALDIPMPSMPSVPSSSNAGVDIESSGSVNVSNTSVIRSNTSATASTGGNSVGSGGSVTTGNASASSHSEVHSSGGKTTVDIEVSADTNGEKKSQSVHKELEGGRGVSVEVNASTKGGTSKTQVTVNGEIVEAASTSKATSTSDSDYEEGNTSEGFVLTFFKSVSLAIHSVFSFFKFW